MKRRRLLPLLLLLLAATLGSLAVIAASGGGPETARTAGGARLSAEGPRIVTAPAAAEGTGPRRSSVAGATERSGTAAAGAIESAVTGTARPFSTSASGAIRSSGTATAGAIRPPRAAPAGAIKPSGAATAEGAARVARGSGWVDVDYGALVDRRRLSHSGESIGGLLQFLEGRPGPPAEGKPEDAAGHTLLDPLLEPFAFVLADTLDAIDPVPDPPLVEIGYLWQPGVAQPGWVELLRARRFLVESNGLGRFRLCLPWGTPGEGGAVRDGSALPSSRSADAARLAWEGAWPVLRHVFAAERRRLARQFGDRPENHPIDAEVFAYTPYPARTRFHLGLGSYRTRVEDTRARSARRVPDLAAWQRFLDKGLQLEGGRIERDGTIRLLGSEMPGEGESPARPSLLGRSISLSDFAVAYRAVFHGGTGEPYMSLDRGNTPETSVVNYGGRLRDTSLGLVSLLCDIRFKTFSLGIDVLEGSDVRDRVRRGLPTFRTHAERFAADARSQTVMTQQTRLWFYPDSVELTLSSQGDVLAMRRARMSAASERVPQDSGGIGTGEPDPPWTRATVAAINTDYDKLGEFFPELADLDQVVRLLSFFTWLREARADGLPVPDLDVLLALELPQMATPRSFPQLLAYNAMPAAGGKGAVDIFDRSTVGAALERLQPVSGDPMPAARRFRRALAALDRKRSDHAALALEMDALDPGALDDRSLDLYAYRAERLRMHQEVLGTLPAAGRSRLEGRGRAGETIRTISSAIGGLDLGMSQALARAKGRDEKLGAGSGSAAGAFAGDVSGKAEPRDGAGHEGATPGRPAPSDEGDAGEGATGQWGLEGESTPREGLMGQRRRGDAEGAVESGLPPLDDPPLLPPTELPDHGLTGGPERVPERIPPPPSRQQIRLIAGGWVRRGGTAGAASGWGWIQTVYGADGADPRARLLLLGPDGRVRSVERLEERGIVRYRIEANEARVTIRLTGAEISPLVSMAAPGPLRPLPRSLSSPSPAEPLPPGLVTLELLLPGAEGEGAWSEAGDNPGLAESVRDSGRTGGSAAAAGIPGDMHDVEQASVPLRLRGAEGRRLDAGFPRAILQRLVLGKEADLTPDRPLPGLSPAQKILGGAQRVMVTATPENALPPWAGSGMEPSGEEDPATFARALARWWAAEAGGSPAPTVTLGTDPATSFARWRGAPAPGADAALFLPADGFEGRWESARARVAEAWKGGRVIASLDLAETSSLVILVTAEPPGTLGARLRTIARDPSMKGKMLAVWSLGGPIRTDLPASLLAEGKLAALALGEFAPLDQKHVVEAIKALRAALAVPAGASRRPEDLPGPWLWFF